MPAEVIWKFAASLVDSGLVDSSGAMSEQLKFSNPMNALDDDAGGVQTTAASSKIDNPLGVPLSSSADHQQQMDEYFEGQDKSEEIDEVVPALILYYLFEDATCKSSQPPAMHTRERISTPTIVCAGFSRFGKKGIPMKVIATVINLGINVLILVSTVAFCVSTMKNHSDDCHKNPESCEDYKVLWQAIELFCVSVFTLDVLVRGIAGYKGGKWEEVKGDAMNWVDLFAILPFYVQLVFPSDYDLRFLRVIRLARILKLMEASGYGNVGATIWEIIVASSTALMVPIFFMNLALIVCSALLYFAEQTVSMTCTTADGVFPDWDTAISTPGNEGCTSDYGCQCAGEVIYITRSGEEWSSEIFASIPHCFWWCIVTFTTVGYGDISPRTAAGQWINVATMILGIFFVAMPIAIIGDAFTTAWGKVEALRREKKSKDAAVEDATESLVNTEVKHIGPGIGTTEHDIKRHMGRAKSYLRVLKKYDTEVNDDVRQSTVVAVELLEEAESIFAAAVQLFKARGLAASSAGDRMVQGVE